VRRASDAADGKSNGPYPSCIKLDGPAPLASTIQVGEADVREFPV
jgi:hypothetical protein